jgi:RNA polymerase sigma-70 factor (ECF subfamily)
MMQTVVAPEVIVSDAELVGHVVAGDSHAYAELVNRHQRHIYRHARGMGLDHDTSLDIVQDTFVRAYDSLAECREPGRFRAWALRIARNLCLDHLKNIRRQTVPMSEVSGIETFASADVDDGDVASTLREALQRLPEFLREAFLLKHDAGYTYEEIAELTNATPSAVKMRVHRARESLRSFLMDQGVGA